MKPESPAQLGIDRYVRTNHSALTVFDMSGHDEFNGVDGRTLHALARRGLVWFESVDPWAAHKRYRGGLTPRGREVLARLDKDDRPEDEFPHPSGAPAPQRN